MQHPDAFPIIGNSEGGPEDAAPLAAFPLEEQLLVALAHQPWASASDLAKRLDMSDSDIYKACHQLVKSKDIAARELSVTRRITRRYVLARKGVMHVTTAFQYKGLLRAALPLTWQMTEEGVTKMLLGLPMIESLYEVLPTFWTCGLATPFQWQSRYADPSCSSHVWLGVPTLTEVLWLPRGRLHAVAIWTFERYSQRPRSYSIPFLWTGLLTQEDFRSRSLRLGSEYVRSARDPQDYIWWSIEPPVVAIGVDQFGAFRSKLAYGDDVQVGSVDTAGALVWSAEASHSEWTLRDKPPQARSIGHPEAAAIEEGPDLVNLGGMREYRLIGFLADFRAATRANLVRAFHMSRGAVTTVLERLTARGLITSVGENLYITQRGLEMFAARDKVDVGRLVEVTYPDPEGEDAARERRHDSAVAAVAAAFQGAGIPVAAGWRWVVSWHDGQLVPDLWVQVPGPGGDAGTWVAVEVEFSAKTAKRIEAKKLRSYRLASVRLGQAFPLLVITGDPLPAQLFDDLARDLPVLTTTLTEFLTGVWEGPESVWRRKDRPVALSEIASEYRGHLWQGTGRVPDYSKPTAEVWTRLRGEEYISSEPYAEGLGRGLPTIDFRLHVDMDRVLNEAKAEPSANRRVSAPMAPTSTPTPVKKASTAQDYARRRQKLLIRMDWLVASADEIAESRLKRRDLSDVERLCLLRVRAIITYGGTLHYQAERLVEQSLQHCLMLKDKHLRAARSGNPLWWLTMSETKINPKAAFRNLLADHPNVRRPACKTFNEWARMVEQADRAGRRSRTPE